MHYHEFHIKIKLSYCLVCLLSLFSAHSNAQSSYDGEALQKIINTQCASNGGEISLPARVIHIRSSLRIACAVRISGMGWQEQPTQQNLKGTWFSIDETSEPAIRFLQGSKGASLENVAFIEPQQKTELLIKQDWKPIPMPPVLSLEQVRGRTYLHNIYMHNVDQGIKSISGGRTTIEGLYGQFFRNAIHVDGEEDITRISDIHVWPYASNINSIIIYQQEHLNAIEMGRVDGAFLDNIFVFGAKNGILLFGKPESPTATGVEIGKLECDSTAHCLRVEAFGATLQISEMRQFGQRGISDGVPLTDADAISITGQVSIMAGQIEARMIDKSVISFENKNYCSNVRVGNIFADFKKSKSLEHSIFSQVPCGRNNARNEFLVANRPAILTQGD